MEPVEVTWRRVLRVWWSYFWRATLLGALASILFATGAAYVLVWLGYPGYTGQVGAMVGYLVTIPVSILCIKLLLGRSFSGFRLLLVKDSTEQES